MSQLASSIRADAWSAADTEGWGRSIFVPHSLLVSEVFETVQVAVVPCRVAVPGELVRVHIDRLALMPHADVIRAHLKREIEPFIIGVGEVTIEQTPEGFVVMRGNCRKAIRTRLDSRS